MKQKVKEAVMKQELQAEKTEGKPQKEEGPKAVFVDANAMKQKVKEAVMKPEYNVANFYKDTGICQRIAKSNLFDSLTLSIIGMNALWIAIDTDLNDSST